MNPRYDYKEDMWLFSYDWLGDATKQEEELAEELRAGTFLENVLPNLTHLRTVTIDNLSIVGMSGPTKTAVPLSIILAILSSRQIQNVTISGYLYHPEDPTPLIPSGSIQCNLRSLIYDLSVFRRQPRIYPSEKALLEALIPILSHTLEKLVAPVENVPLETIKMQRWPHLRVLTLYGQRHTMVDSHTPAIAVFANMPNLRCLDLFLANPEGVEPQAICPDGFSGTFPWPELERLTVAQPLPSDNVWAYLPLCLQALILRYWPRRGDWYSAYLQGTPVLHMSETQWRMPHLPASDVLRILQQCRTPQLKLLGMDYQVDEQEISLFRHIARSFSSLESLHIYRYQDCSSPEASLVSSV